MGQNALPFFRDATFVLASLFVVPASLALDLAMQAFRALLDRQVGQDDAYREKGDRHDENEFVGHGPDQRKTRRAKPPGGCGASYHSPSELPHSVVIDCDLEAVLVQPHVEVAVAFDGGPFVFRVEAPNVEIALLGIAPHALI